MIKRLFILFCLFSIINNSNGNNYNFNIDSLKTIIDTTLNDSIKVHALLRLGEATYLSNPYEADKYWSRGAEIAEKHNSEYFRLRASECYNDLGVINRRLSNYNKAIEYYLKSLKVREVLKDTTAIATTLRNIGVVYNKLNENEKAIEYYLKALELYKTLNKQNGIAHSYNSIAMVLKETDASTDSILTLYNNALKIFTEENDSVGLSKVLNNKAVFYAKLGDIKFSNKLHFKSLKIKKLLKDLNGLAFSFYNLSENYIKLNKLDSALYYAFQAIEYGKKMNNKEMVADCYLRISEIYETKKIFNKALEYFKNYKVLFDSIYNENNNKELARMEARYDFDKKQAIIDAEQKRKQKILEEEKKRQKLIIWAISIVLFLFVIIAIILFYGWKRKKEDNLLIKRQKLIVEEKNKEITDSINYAKRIQSAILPSKSKIKEYLKDFFIFYKPKDIVAGDFYWLETGGSSDSNTVYFAAADCTGHGVPGAMVSVICSNALTKTVVEEKITDPGKILDRTRELVIEHFAKSSEEVNDGMDISLCAIDFANMTLKWAGANNPLWIVRNVELEMLNDESKNEYSKFNTQNLKLIEIKPDKQPIGNVENPQPFTTHTIKLQKGDIIYIFTDGYADQFGGENIKNARVGGKKFKPKALKELLLSIHSKTLKEQQKILENTFYLWKGDLEQIDDICIMGVRI